MVRAYPRQLGRRFVMALSATVTLTAVAAAITNATTAAPVAEDISYTGAVYRATPYETRTAVVDLAGDGGDGAARYEIVAQPSTEEGAVGTAAVSGTQATLAIDPDAPVGAAQFGYVAVGRDGTRSNEATVSFEIANRKPLTRALALTTSRDVPLDIWPYARDAESGGPFVWRREKNRLTYSDPEHGTIEPFFGTNGSEPDFADIDHKVVYVPDSGYVGADSFKYTFTDEDGTKSSSTVSVDVVDGADAAASEARGVRYRCALNVRTDDDARTDADGRYDAGATRRLSRYLGGDLMINVAAGAEAPRQVAPGEAYELRDPWVTLRPEQGFADLLTGAPVGGERDLREVGFAQSSVAASADLSVQVRRLPSGNSRGFAVDGLEAEPVNTGSEDLTMRLTGLPPTLRAPGSGAVEVTLPQVFHVDLSLDPGLSGRDDSIGLRCYAAHGDRLRIARVAVARD